MRPPNLVASQSQTALSIILSLFPNCMEAFSTPVTKGRPLPPFLNTLLQ